MLLRKEPPQSKDDNLIKLSDAGKEYSSSSLTMNVVSLLIPKLVETFLKILLRSHYHRQCNLVGHHARTNDLGNFSKKN